MISSVVATSAALVLGGSPVLVSAAGWSQAAVSAIGRLSALPGDPYSTVAGQHHTAVEPSAFAVGDTVIAAYQVGRHVAAGADNIGWARSTNSGRAWNGGVLPGITKVAGGAWDFTSDPSVTYDARHHVWLIAAIVGILQRGEGVSVNRSTDDGRTWRRPLYADRGMTHFYDKDWIVCDNHTGSRFYGRCYLTWEDGISQQLYMQWSPDAGRHWSRPIRPGVLPIGQGGEPVVQPTGRVVVPYLGTTALIGLGISIESFSSSNGGRSWTRSVKIADLHERFFEGTYRTYATPSVGVAADGRVFVVWQACQFEPGCATDDLVISTSTNGQKWSPARRIPTRPPGSGSDALTPAISVDESTRGLHASVAITYYKDSHPGCGAPCTLAALTMTSADGGKRWSRPRLLASGIDTAWLAKTSLGPMIGDYIGAAFASRGNAVGVFVVANPPSGQTLDERVVSDTEHVLRSGSRKAL